MSTDLNSVMIIGRLTRDMELKYLNSGTAVGHLSIACNDSVKGPDGQYADKAHFFEVTVWGRTAEGLQQYLTKGRQIAIEGRLRQETWTDNQSGQNRSKVTINAQRVQLLAEPKNQGNQQGPTLATYSNNQYQAPEQRTYYDDRYEAPPAPPQQQSFQGGGYPGPEHFNDDIPF